MQLTDSGQDRDTKTFLCKLTSIKTSPSTIKMHRAVFNINNKLLGRHEACTMTNESNGRYEKQ